MSCVVLLAAQSVWAVDKSWHSDKGDWSSASKWTPLGVPLAGDVVYLGNLENVASQPVFLDIDDVVAGLHITDGMNLQMSGHSLRVTGDTTVSGENFVLPDLAQATSRIAVTNGAALVDFETDDLTVDDRAKIGLFDGSRLDVNGTFQVLQTASLEGAGEVHFAGAGTTFVNNGTVRGSSQGPLELFQTAGGLYDLDGAGGGTLSPSHDQPLAFHGEGLSDPFSGELRLAPRARLEMDLANGWAMDAQGKISVLGFVAGDAARITGSSFELGGEVNFGAGADGYLRVEAETKLASTAKVDIPADGVLEFDGKTAVTTGAQLALESGGRLYFDGATTLQGATFTGDGQVIFHGPLTVSNATTINAEIADLDGRLELGVPQTHKLNAALTLNVADIELPGSQEGFGHDTLEINGIQGRLNVNLNGGAKSWTVHESGTLDINGNALEATHLTGSPLRLNGTALVSNRSRWDAPVDVAGTLTLETPATQLRLMSPTASTIRASAEVTGPGLFIVGPPALLRLEQGANLQTALRNDGRLELGVPFGAALVSQFEQTDAGSLAIEIGGITPGTQHDVLQVADAAKVAGKLEVSLAGGFAPVHWNTFDVLTTTKGLSGAFDELALPDEFNHLKLDVKYLPLGVRVRTIAALLGDADADGDVDLSDFGVLKNNFGVAGWGVAGDVDYDEDVDLTDFGILKENFGNSGAVAVPEPSTWLLAAWGCAALLTARRLRTLSLRERAG
ncbi:MAG: hypothetical protein U0836_12970 [Pirellulales bacterium]